MYQLKLAQKPNDILEFEKMRAEVFDPARKIDSIIQSPFANAIMEGDMLAFRCLNNSRMVGGMLLKLSGKNIKIVRLFVDANERGEGAGSFMLDYVEKHKDFFEDYYAEDIDGILLEPLESAVDFYFDKGYDYSGFQMFKRYDKKGR